MWQLLAFVWLALLAAPSQACFGAGDQAVAVDAPEPTEVQTSADTATDTLVAMLATQSAPSMERMLDAKLVEQMPADAFLRLIDRVGASRRRRSRRSAPLPTPPWFKDMHVYSRVMDVKTIQTSGHIFMLLGEMSRNELYFLPWDSVSKGLHAEAFNKLPPDTIKSMPWAEIWPLLSPAMARQMSVHSLQSIHSSQFSTITPDVLGAFPPATFGEIPIQSLNEAPAVAFRSVSVEAWRQLGPRKFSVLREDILTEISKQTYEELGRSFLSRVEAEQLRKIQDITENLRDGPPPVANPVIIEDDDRTQEEKLRDTVTALTEVTKRLRLDTKYTWLQELEKYPLRDHFMYEMATVSLNSMSQEARQSMPPDFWEHRNNKLQSVMRQMFSHMSHEDIQTLRWEEIANGLDMSTYNSFSPTTIKHVNWDDVFEHISPSKMGGFTSRTLRLIEATHYQSLTREHVSYMTSEQMKHLTAEQIDNIPPEALEGLGGDLVDIIGADRINQLNEESLSAIDWTEVVQEMDVDTLDNLDDDVFQSMDWQKIMQQMSTERVEQLSVKTLTRLPPEAFRDINNPKMQAFREEFWRRITVEQMREVPPEALRGVTGKQFSMLSEEVILSMTKRQLSEMNWERIMYEIDINEMSPAMLQILPKDAFKTLTARQIDELSEETIEHLTTEQLEYIEWRVVTKDIRTSTFNSWSETTWQKMPDGVFKYMTVEQFTQLDAQVFRILTVEQLRMIRSTHYRQISVEQLRAMGSKKCGELKDHCGDEIPAEVLAEAGDAFGKAVGRESEVRRAKQKLAEEKAASEDAAMQRLIDAMNEESGETVLRHPLSAVFESMQSNEFEKIEWIVVARNIKAYQINSLSQEYIEKMPWHAMWREFPRSTLESVQLHVWEVIPAENFRTMRPQVIEFLETETVAQFPLASLEEMPPSAFSGFHERTVTRMESRKFASISIERLNMIHEDSYRRIPSNHLEALGEAKYYRLTGRIRRTISTTTKARVSYLKDGEDGLPPTAAAGSSEQGSSEKGSSGKGSSEKGSSEEGGGSGSAGGGGPTGGGNGGPRTRGERVYKATCISARGCRIVPDFEQLPTFDSTGRRIS